MRVFFTTTPRLKIKYSQNVEAIFQAIENLGYKITNDYLRRVDVGDFYKFKNEKVPAYYKEVMSGAKKADVVIFETSLRSTGVGQMLQWALSDGKCVIALHMESKFPFWIGGIKSEKLIIEEYMLKNIEEVLAIAFDQIKDQMDERFTLLLPPKIVGFLNEISKKKNIPKSVFIRNLIKEKMEVKN